MIRETLELMEERRKCKIRNDIQTYRRSTKKNQDEISGAKKIRLTKRCEEAENLNRLNDAFNPHKKINEIAGIYQKNTIHFIRDRNNIILAEADRISEKWKEYATKVFNDNSRK